MSLRGILIYINIVEKKISCCYLTNQLYATAKKALTAQHRRGVILSLSQLYFFWRISYWSAEWHSRNFHFKFKKKKKLLTQFQIMFVIYFSVKKAFISLTSFESRTWNWSILLLFLSNTGKCYKNKDWKKIIIINIWSQIFWSNICFTNVMQGLMT